MCRATVDGGGFRPRGGRRLVVSAFYLRVSSSAAPTPPRELSLVYRPEIGGAALVLDGRKLPPASHAEVTLLLLRAEDGGAAYASSDRVSAAEGARFEVYAGKELAAEGVFLHGGTSWRVECRRAAASATVAVAEVLILAEGGVLLRGKARAASARLVGCRTARLEGIPEEEAAVPSSWPGCMCGEDWEVVVDDDDGGDEWRKMHEATAEMETVGWALEMGAWAVFVGVGLLATARRLRRKRTLR